MRHPPNYAPGNFVAGSLNIHGLYLFTLSLHLLRYSNTMAPTVMPNSDTQDSTDPHVPAGNATHALVTFWASLALLGASVVFLLVYSAFKMFRNDGGRHKITHKGSKRAATARRSGRQFTQRAGTTLCPLMLGINRFGRAGHGAVSEVRTNTLCVIIG